MYPAHATRGDTRGDCQYQSSFEIHRFQCAEFIVGSEGRGGEVIVNISGIPISVNINGQ